MEVRLTLTKRHIVIFIAAVIGITVALGVWFYFRGSNASGGIGSTITSNTVGGSQISTPEGEAAKEIQSIAEKEGIVAAYARVKQDYGQNPAAGHDFAHLIGQLAYKKDGTAGFSVCDTDFGFGCYHGLFDMVIRDEGESAISNSQKACGDLGLPGPVASCIHGIGHGVMGYSGKIDPAVELCGRLSESGRIYCYDGAYMELFTGVMKGEMEAPAVAEDDPWKYCRERKAESQSQCVRNAVIYFLATRVFSQQAVAGLCDKLDLGLKPHCVLNYGIYAAQIANGSVDSVTQSCSLFGDNQDRGLCQTNAAREFIFQNRPQDLAQSICTPLEKQFADACLQEINIMKTNYGR